MSKALEIDLTFISAGAGSGKTHRLTELLHQELTSRGVRPAGVIATTFTHKAAAELRHRVRAHLLRQGQFGLAHAMAQARIGTVNSVCGQLLSRFAFEAGLSPAQQVLDEAQARLMLDKAIDDALEGPELTELLALVQRLGLGQAQGGQGNGDEQPEWKQALEALVNQARSNDIAPAALAGFVTLNAEQLLAHFPAPTTQDLDAGLLAAIRSASPRLVAAVASAGRKNTRNYLELIERFARELEQGRAAWGAWLKLSKDAPEAGLRASAEPITALAARVAEHPALHADLRRYLTLIFGLAGRALSHYQARKREHGVLDFTDQEHLLLGLLDHPEVVAVLEDELDLLMVDEFQDTSPIQLALFLKLARLARRVYWVGDVKQAIYGFRGSDTALMQAILAALPAMGGRKEVLPASWRSRPDLVDTVNAVFASAFADSLPADEVALKPMRADTLPDPALANWLLGGKNLLEEAQALAAGVHKLVDSAVLIHDKASRADRPLRFGDIVVLAWSNARVSELASVLAAQGIPVSTAQHGLLATPEATLVLACLRRLVDPEDTVASAQILAFADGLEPEQWVADRLRYLARGGAPGQWREQGIDGHPAHPLLQTLSALREALPLLAPREALTKVIAACALEETIVRWGTDPGRARVRLARLEALVDLAAQYEADCRIGQQAGTVAGLILWFDALAAQGQDRVTEPAVDAVRIMTHHAAKGLEWPVVVLTDLGRELKDRLWSISACSTWPVDFSAPLADRHLRYWPWPFGAQKKANVAEAIAQSATATAFRQAAVEEAKRLLYVSMTRARDLMVFARSARNPESGWVEVLAAPWLLPDEGEDRIRLPDGSTVRAERWRLEPSSRHVEADESATPGLHWFRSARPAQIRHALNVSPSTAQGGQAMTVSECCRIGERIELAAATDMNALGTALHACLASSFTDRAISPDEAEVARVLDAYGVGEQVSAAAVVRQIRAFQDWIDARWPDARAYAEVPVQQVLDSGQVIGGRIDLLLATAAGWILIDHKSAPHAPEHWGDLALRHGPQLRAYATALEAVTGTRVAQTWLFLPVAGGGIALA